MGKDYDVMLANRLALGPPKDKMLWEWYTTVIITEANLSHR